MKTKSITYDQLEQVLLRLGYTTESNSDSDRVIFRHPDTTVPVILPKMNQAKVLQPIDLLSVRNALAYGGIVPKSDFDSLFHMEPIELWEAIKAAEIVYENQHGQPPRVLKLPVPQAYDLAKLRRAEFGPLAERVMCEGIKVFEKEGLLGIPVELVPGDGEFSFE